MLLSKASCEGNSSSSTYICYELLQTPSFPLLEFSKMISKIIRWLSSKDMCKPKEEGEMGGFYALLDMGGFSGETLHLHLVEFG